jgi:hypothetical protein
MELADLLAANPKFHRDGAGRPLSWRVSDDVLRLIDARVTDGSKTLETGAGVSTVLFAMKRAHHVCVAPDGEEIARIEEFCDAHHVPRDRLTFEVDFSERVLPRLQIDGLDLVLIDGAHAFPIPFLDWYYAAARLRVGGLLLVDDTQLWTGHTLKTFLAAEPGWTLEADFPPRTAVFRKREQRSGPRNESEQPYVMEETLNLVFRSYPEYVEWFRPFLPTDGFRARESSLAFRAFRARAATRRLLSRLARFRRWFAARGGQVRV